MTYRYHQLQEDMMEAFNLEIWLPALFGLGLAAMFLLFAFVAGCARV